MLPSIISKLHRFRPHHLSKLQIVIFYHTSPRSNPLSPPESTSPPAQIHLSSVFAANSAPTHFEKLDFEPATVVETLNSYANDWKLALEFFDWVETECGFQHTAHTLYRIVDILGKFFEFEMAWDLIERLRKNGGCLPDHTTFRVLFKRYVLAHLVKEAIDAFVRSNDYNLRDEVSFSNLIDALCEYKHVIEAEELFFKKKWGDQYDDYWFCFNGDDTKIYNMILRGWFKMEWWRKCREFWEEMDKRGVKKDFYSYSIYMDIQCKSKKPWKAVKLYKEMKKKGIELDTVAYNTVIRAIGISEGVDVAVRLFKEMNELGCRPNVVTFNTILKLLCENGRYIEAHKVLNLMSKKGIEPNIVTYHCFFACLENPREILKYLKRMIDSGIQRKMDTYVMLMRKFGRWGFLRPVLMLWKNMEVHGLSPNEFAYNALIDVLLQKGLVDMARKYDGEMFQKGLSAKPRAELQTKLDNEESGNVKLSGSKGAPNFSTIRCSASAPSKKYNINLLLGDGIGPEVVSVAKNSLQLVASLEGFDFKFKEVPVGGAAIDLSGVPLPEETLLTAKDSDVVLLGAIGGYKWDINEKHLKPETGLLQLRAVLKVFANLRPVMVVPQLVDASTLKTDVAEGVDLTVVRELTGGIYFGKPRGFGKNENGEDIGFNIEVYSAHEIDRIARVAFETARKRSGKLCSVDKANVVEVINAFDRISTCLILCLL